MLFFFKQKTAYEMRISDWSSDVCSSDLDLVDRFITVELAARPASKGQYGFKFVLNSSINHVVCHGVPDADEIVRDGDIINLDITLEKNGFIADSSKTYLIGDVSSAAKRLVRVAQEAMWKGIGQVRPGAHIGAIGFAIERHAKKNGYSIVREFCGHGIGSELHEEPQVMNFGRLDAGMRLRGSMVFWIEPMMHTDTPKFLTKADG